MPLSPCVCECEGILYVSEFRALVTRGNMSEVMQPLAHATAVLFVPSPLEVRPLVPLEGPLAPENQALPKNKE